MNQVMNRDLQQPRGMLRVPVATILAWDPSLLDDPVVPPGFLECNGQVVTDTRSPLFGKTLPNLNQGSYLTGGPMANVGQAVGSNSASIGAGNLPNTPITGTLGSASAGTPTGSVSVDSGGVHTHTVTDPGHFHDIDGQAASLVLTLTGIDASGSGPKKGKTASKTTGVTVNSGGAHAHNGSFTGQAMPGHTHSLSMSLNSGQQTPLDNRPSSLVVRWIIRIR